MTHHQVLTFHVFRMPKQSGYKMDDMLVVNVVWDDSYYLATCADATISNAYGTGKTIGKAIKDLLLAIAKYYELDAKYARKGKLGARLLAQHEALGMIISKR